MDERIQKTLHYKVARYQLDGKRSLEADLLAAFRSKKLTKDRYELLDEDGTRKYRLVNSLEESDQLSFGTLLSYTEGVHQSIIAIDEDADSFDLHTIAPQLPDDEGRAEFMDGQLFVGIKRNHVIVLASQQFTLGRLENHLNWFLCSHCGILPTGEKIHLSDPVVKSNRDYSRTGLKSLTFEAPIETNLEEENESAEGVQSTSEVRLGGRGWQMVVEWFKLIGEEPPTVNLLGGIPPEELSITLTIRARRSRARTSDGGVAPTPVIDTLALALRNNEDEDVPLTLEFKDGRKLHAKDLKLRTKTSIEHSNGIVRQETVAKAMRDWFQDLLVKDTVDPA